MSLVVNIGGIDVTADYQINKPSFNSKSVIICLIKIDTGVYHKFPYITKNAEFLKVKISSF